MGILSQRLALIFLVPAGLLLAVFLLLPALWSIGQSFTNFTLLGPEAQKLRFVGLHNYFLALQDPYFWNALRISFVYVFGSALLGQAGVGLVLALVTQRAPGWLGNLARGMAVIAWITPAVVVAILWNVFLGDRGTFNQMLGWVGLGGSNWLLDHPWLCLVAYNTWRGAAFSMLLFDAALRSIPDSYYEAASVFGARSWRQFWDITFPMIRAQMLTAVLLITLWTFNDFGPYLLTAGGPAYQTEVLPIYTYRVAFRSFELGYGAAMSTLLLLVNLVLASIYLKWMPKK
jgi:multiple sugar transport system permease protein